MMESILSFIWEGEIRMINDKEYFILNDEHPLEWKEGRTILSYSKFYY